MNKEITHEQQQVIDEHFNSLGEYKEESVHRNFCGYF